MNVRIFGSTTCANCHYIERGLKLLSVPFTFIDAQDEANDAICDLYNVDALPHVQIIDENDQVVWEKAKHVALPDILFALKNQNNETQ
jgi:hypothetical protein